jgi:hypothetical protein
MWAKKLYTHADLDRLERHSKLLDSMISLTTLSLSRYHPQTLRKYSCCEDVKLTLADRQPCSEHSKRKWSPLWKQPHSITDEPREGIQILQTRKPKRWKLETRRWTESMERSRRIYQRYCRVYCPSWVKLDTNQEDCLYKNSRIPCKST